MNRFPSETPNTRGHRKLARSALDLVCKHQAIPERIGARQERDRIHSRARRWVDARVRRDGLDDVGDVRAHDVRRELYPDRETGVLPKELCEDVEEACEGWACGVVRRGWTGGYVGAARVELDGDARCPFLLGCAEALDGFEHETEVGRVGFGDADDERFRGVRGAFEDGGDPSVGADVAGEGVGGVAVGVEGGGVFEKGDLDRELVLAIGEREEVTVCEASSLKPPRVAVRVVTAPV